MPNVDSVIAKLKEATGCLADVELAKALGGIAPSTISTWRKRKTIPYDKIEEVSSQTNIPFVWFVDDEDDKWGGKTAPVFVPILNQIPTDFPRGIKKEDYRGYLSVPGIPKGVYALIAPDEAMSPMVRQGDHLLFEFTKKWQSGDLVVCQDAWGKILIRRCRDKDGHFFLVSENPEYPPFVKDNGISLCGRVVDIWRNVKL